MKESTLKMLLDHCGHQDKCDPVCDQYRHSLARFNDTSSQTVASSQQAFAQAMSVHSAHLLRLQADICRVDTPT